MQYTVHHLPCISMLDAVNAVSCVVVFDVKYADRRIAGYG